MTKHVYSGCLYKVGGATIDTQMLHNVVGGGFQDGSESEVRNHVAEAYPMNIGKQSRSGISRTRSLPQACVGIRYSGVTKKHK